MIFFQTYQGIDLTNYNDCFNNLPIAQSFKNTIPNYSGSSPTNFIELVNTGVFSPSMILQMIQMCDFIKQTGSLGPFHSFVQG